MSELGVQVSAAQPAPGPGAEQALMVMRLRRGVVGESRRVSHVVPVPGDGAWPEKLTALCGERITGRQAEVLTTATGMPCVHCVSRLPIYESISALPA
ncbi:hypothetical protein [Gandjariella thermophila]|uniref:hypothetical protein n=1 Tax=Gandjariella thermophila TaxID=1931992 RepID=UPI001CEFAE6D|nr:hypothetical protein [Gandjariella thermophila]